MNSIHQLARNLRVQEFHEATMEDLADEVREWLGDAGEKIVVQIVAPATAEEGFGLLIFYAE